MASRGGDRALFGEPILVEFVGSTASVFTVRGQASRKSYRFGRDGFHERQYVEAGDVEALLALPDFRLAGVPQPGASQPSAGPEPQPLAAAVRPDRQPQREAPPAPAPAPPPAPPPESPAEPPGAEPEPATGTMPVPAPQPAPEASDQDPEPETPSNDPADMTVAFIREEVKAMGVRALEVMLADEERGKARTSALKAIQDALNASA